MGAGGAPASPTGGSTDMGSGSPASTAPGTGTTTR
jgi:hypothetical protein